MTRTFTAAIFALLFVIASAVASLAATGADKPPTSVPDSSTASGSVVAKQADDNPVKAEWLVCTSNPECVLVAQNSQCKILAVNKKYMDQFPSLKTCVRSPSFDPRAVAACTSQGKCVTGHLLGG